MHSQQLQAEQPPIESLSLEGVGPAQQEHLPLRAGDLCPSCQVERLDYDGLLNLTCPRCGGNFSSGCYT
ncbi:MAG: hypothetical protein AB1894_27100 [Chloroflexota bacterium]